MNAEQLRMEWKQEEEVAHVYGWDFSHIDGRYQEGERVPWNYDAIVRGYLREETRLLDYDTGGGEYLLTLGHPYARTAATEGYPPNVKLCQERLLPLGIDLRECSDPSRAAFVQAGFEILRAEESFQPITFFDVGAFVWFAHIIEWEFPGFSVERCFAQLLEMQREIEARGRIEGTTHRYLIVARK